MIKRVLFGLVLLAFAFPSRSPAQVAGSGVAGTTSVSGTALPNVANAGGVLHASFEEIPTGSPATVSVTVVGCMRGGTCDAASNTNTTATATIVYVTFAKAYDYFVVTPSWTGGTAVTYTVNYRIGAN